MSNTNLPLISVIIPTCHRNDLLALCLDCLAPGVQTLPPEQYEVIVTDDGLRSTAQQMVQEHYLWAKWVAGPGQGRSANRNQGAQTSRGEWLAFTDDDCLPTAEWLAAYAGAITPNVFVYEGKTTCKAGINSPLEEAPINLAGGCLWSCNMMIQRDAFEAVDGFDIAFVAYGGEDIDLRERLRKSGYTFPFVAEAVVDHPPRRCRFGKEAGLTWEGQVLLWHRAGKTHLIPAKLLLLVAKVRVKNLVRFPLQRQSFLAMVSLVLELGYIIQKVASWQAKHFVEVRTG